MYVSGASKGDLEKPYIGNATELKTSNVDTLHLTLGESFSEVYHDHQDLKEFSEHGSKSG